MLHHHEGELFDAPEERKEQENDQPQHTQGDEGGKTTKASGSDRHAEGGKGT
jgi:hypothetical protein